MIKQIAIGSLALVFSVSAGMAGGLKGDKQSYKDEPVYEASGSFWSGPYIGATLGYGSGTSDHYLERAGHGAADNDPDGALGGVTAGYNMQFREKWILGVEADLSLADIEGDNGKVVYDDHSWETGWGSILTIRGRAGYDLGDTLVYGTLGYAGMDSSEYIIGNTKAEGTDNSGWHNGWVAGVGLERAFTDRISGKIEYLHFDFEDTNGLDGNNEAFSFENDLDVVRVGLNYKIH